MKGKILIVIEALIICVLISYFYFYREMKKDDGKLLLYGNIDIRQVDLGFRVYGRVDTLNYEEGDPVNPGDLLAVLDNVPYLEAVQKTQAEVDSIKAQLLNAEIQFQRREVVSQEAISKEDFDTSFFKMESLKAALAGSVAELASKETALSDTELLCPTAGVILTRIKEVGSIVNVGDPVYTVSITTPVWVRAYISEPDLGKIYPGMEALVFSDTKTLPTYHGKIGFISPVAEFTPKTVETPDLRTDLVYRLRIYIDDPDSNLRQGMPVTVKLDTQGPKRGK